MLTDISASTLRSMLDYDQETGALTWRARTPDMFKGGIRPKASSCSCWNTQFAGKEAGAVNGSGTRIIRINGRLYLAHRLAWLWMTGEWPKEEIDHVNRCPSDNRFLNIREATRSQNQANTLGKNKSGVKGVYWNTKANKWLAQIRVNGRQQSIGYFDALEDAAAAYANAARETHGKFARTS